MNKEKHTFLSVNPSANMSECVYVSEPLYAHAMATCATKEIGLQFLREYSPSIEDKEGKPLMINPKNIEQNYDMLCTLVLRKMNRPKRNISVIKMSTASIPPLEESFVGLRHDCSW